jgi:hypothetical protein
MSTRGARGADADRSAAGAAGFKDTGRKTGAGACTAALDEGTWTDAGAGVFGPQQARTEGGCSPRFDAQQGIAPGAPGKQIAAHGDTSPRRMAIATTLA